MDFSPVQHKLLKLLRDDLVELMFSQPENRFDFHSIMDTGKIFVANLSQVGPESRDVLAKFLLAFFHLAALARSAIPKDLRKPYHIHADEAHRFVSDVVEDLIAETRKYNVSLTLAHQHLKQFTRDTAESLGIVGSTIVFNVHHADAERMAKILGAGVEADDLKSLGEGEAFARIGAHVVKFRTPRLSEIVDPSARDRTVQLSRERYCKHVSEIRDISRRRRGRAAPSTKAALPSSADGTKEFTYDEL